MTDSGLLLLDESETKHALMNYLGYKEKREADSLRSPLMIYYNYVLLFTLPESNVGHRDSCKKCS